MRTMRKLSLGALVALALISLSANALLYLRYSSRRPLLRIRGAVITKKQYFDLLESRYGQPVLSKLVMEEVVRQAAERARVWPTDKEVEARLVELQRIAPQTLGPDSSDPDRRQALEREVASSIALENLRIGGVSVSEAGIAAFYRANRKAFTPPPQAGAIVVVTAGRVDAAIAADLLRRNMPPQVIARQPRLNVVGLNNFNPAWQSLPAGELARLGSHVLRMKPGTVAVFPVQGMFVTVRVRQQSPGTPPPLSKIRDRVARLARLDKAPGAEVTLARLYRDAHVTFETGHYAGYFDAFEKRAEASGGRVAGKTASLR